MSILYHEDVMSWKLVPHYWFMWGESICHRWVFHKRPETCSFDALWRWYAHQFDVCMNKLLSERLICFWFENFFGHMTCPMSISIIINNKRCCFNKHIQFSEPLYDVITCMNAWGSMGIVVIYRAEISRISPSNCPHHSWCQHLTHEIPMSDMGFGEMEYNIHE